MEDEQAEKDEQAERDGLTERERQDKEKAEVNRERQVRLGDIPAETNEETPESETESE